MKISFRKGGDKPFYTALRKVLQEKAWKEDVSPCLRVVLVAIVDLSVFRQVVTGLPQL